MIPTTPRNLGSYTRSPPTTPTHKGSTRGAQTFASLHTASPGASNTRFAGFAASGLSGTPPNSPRPTAAQPTTPRAYNPVPTAATPQTPSSTSLLDVDEDNYVDEDDDNTLDLQPGVAHKSQYPFAGWLKRTEEERIKLILKWGLATNDDGREDFEIGKVHRDYWVATEVRQNARDLGLRIIWDVGRFIERVADVALKVNVGFPETKPEFPGGPCFANQVTVKTFESRYTSGANPDARFASELANEVFLNTIAVPHASKFLVRKRHLMKSQTLRLATARPIPNAIEPWRYIAAPIIPSLTGVAQVNDILAASSNRADERKRWIARRNGHSPTFAGVVEYLKANNIQLATRDAILDMLSSAEVGHHPADDWYSLFTKRYGLAVNIAVGLFVVAVDDATGEDWPF